VLECGAASRESSREDRAQRGLPARRNEVSDVNRHLASEASQAVWATAGAAKARRRRLDGRPRMRARRARRHGATSCDIGQERSRTRCARLPPRDPASASASPRHLVGEHLARASSVGAAPFSGERKTHAVASWGRTPPSGGRSSPRCSQRARRHSSRPLRPARKIDDRVPCGRMNTSPMSPTTEARQNHLPVPLCRSGGGVAVELAIRGGM
jgi:hypothetical protein